MAVLNIQIINASLWISLAVSSPSLSSFLGFHELSNWGNYYHSAYCLVGTHFRGRLYLLVMFLWFLVFSVTL